MPAAGDPPGQNLSTQRGPPAGDGYDAPEGPRAAPDIGALKGFNDVRPQAADVFLDSGVWHHLFAVASDVLISYGYAPVWLPVLENTALFHRGIGADTDIVAKEMYSFFDRGGRAMTLRPEGTAGAARAYHEYHLGVHAPVQKWFYIGPMFRAERPQKGRYRQFYQIGAEYFGVPTSYADAEVVRMLRTLCDRLALTDVRLRLNTLGDAQGRMAYAQALRTFLTAHAGALCARCTTRQAGHVLRVLDCKQPGCRAILADAPDILDSLGLEARRAFDLLQKLLVDAGIDYTRDPQLVRGLDYYTGAIFEFTTDALGAQDAILGGGRYDDLVASLGGPPTPAVGFAAGVERLALLLARAARPAPRPRLHLVPLDAEATAWALQLADAVRAAAPVAVEVELTGHRAKAALRRADRLGATHAFFLGSNERTTGRGQLKHLASGYTCEVAIEAAQLALRVLEGGQSGRLGRPAGPGIG